MKKFEIGKEYFDRSACNYDCIFTIKIIKRTEKTVTFERHGKTRRAKLFCDDRGEYIIPDRYSMAPVFRAECEVQPEEEAPAAEESTVSAPAEDVAPSSLSAHSVHQRNLHAGKLDVSGHQVNAFRVMQDTLAGAQRFVHQDTAHSIRESKGQLIRLRVAQADGQAALRISVNQQHFSSGLCKPYAQIRTGRCFAHTAFLIGDGDDLRIHYFHLVSL